VTDYQILLVILKDLKKREELLIKKKDEQSSVAIKEQEKESIKHIQSETTNLQEKLSQLLVQYDQTIHLKQNANMYVIPSPQNFSQLSKTIREQLNIDKNEQLRNSAVEIMQYITKTTGVTIYNGNCLVCLHVVNNPYVLIKCGHVLCEMCVKEMEKRNKNFKVSKFIECPSCRRITQSTKLYI
jgi:hypothetical protein